MNIENTHERLQAAVSKEPHPSLYNRPNDLSKKLSQSSKSTLNSFLQKMTSFRGKKIDTQSEKNFHQILQFLPRKLLTLKIIL